jgi:hypothetical protein
VNCERGSLARNMSAPPSTTLTFAALAPEAGASGDAIADGAGLTFVCRLDARALLPRKRRNLGATQRSQDPKHVHNRIRVALVYARAEAAGRKRAPPKALARTCAAPVEDVADELRALLATESLADAGLPAFGMFLPPQGGERAMLRSFSRTLAILARRRGGLFLRDADPIVWSAMEGEVLDLWTPAAAPGSPS